MRTNIELDDDLIAEAMKLGGLPTKKAAVDQALRDFVRIKRQLRAIDNLEGIGWIDADRDRLTFDALAAEFRTLTAGRVHTPSEKLMRDGRDEL
jgi:Arc/MetJ family transcription regulator